MLINANPCWAGEDKGWNSGTQERVGKGWVGLEAIYQGNPTPLSACQGHIMLN